MQRIKLLKWTLKRMKSHVQVAKCVNTMPSPKNDKHLLKISSISKDLDSSSSPEGSLKDLSQYHHVVTPKENRYLRPSRSSTDLRNNDHEENDEDSIKKLRKHSADEIHSATLFQRLRKKRSRKVVNQIDKAKEVDVVKSCPIVLVNGQEVKCSNGNVRHSL